MINDRLKLNGNALPLMLIAAAITSSLSRRPVLNSTRPLPGYAQGVVE